MDNVKVEYVVCKAHLRLESALAFFLQHRAASSLVVAFVPVSRTMSCVMCHVSSCAYLRPVRS